MVQSSNTPALKIGTRGSPLALAQANTVRAALAAAHALDPDALEIVVIRTTGDKIQDRPLSEAGGKGLFTKEIEEALLERRIDLAVHSAKDMPTQLPPGLVLTACLAREDVRDALICRTAASVAGLPRGARIGTASLRRQALMKRLRPDLQIASLRGNVETRLRRIDEGAFDATILALAGLKRLALTASAAGILDIEQFPPAPGQGAITLEARADDAHTRALLAAIDHPATTVALTLERAFLAALDGSCRTPIAGHATVDGQRIRFRGLIVRPDGSQAHETAREGSVADAVALGTDAGHELKRRGGPDFFKSD